MTPASVKAFFEIMLNNGMVHVFGAWNERVHVMKKAVHGLVKNPKGTNKGIDWALYS